MQQNSGYGNFSDGNRIPSLKKPAAFVIFIHTIVKFCSLEKIIVHRPKKSLGQNFLQDANVSQKIVRLFNPHSSDVVVEIGPGKGALTALLLETVPHITAVELDNELIVGLQEQFG